MSQEPDRKCPECGCVTDILYGGNGQFVAMCWECWTAPAKETHEQETASTDARVRGQEDPMSQEPEREQRWTVWPCSHCGSQDTLNTGINRVHCQSCRKNSASSGVEVVPASSAAKLEEALEPFAQLANGSGPQVAWVDCDRARRALAAYREGNP